MSATKLDLKCQLHELYGATREPALVDVPGLNFVMVDGHGDPNVEDAYAEAIEALYAVAYTIKFMIKRNDGVNYGVPPLEGLWWTADMATFSGERKDAWDWTMMIMQPAFVAAETVAAAQEKAAAKKALPALERVRFERYEEGRAAQVLHVGPYAAEAPTIAALHAFIAAQGLERAGKHHEIYLGDPRRAAPEKLRTILRQPVA